MPETINKEVNFIDLGLIDYQEAWDYQTKLFDDLVAIKLENRKLNLNRPTSNYLIFCEHPPVYTLGKSGLESHLLVDSDNLQEANISYYKSNRGGDITFHGPGQIVGYPILDLDNFTTDIHVYLRSLEEGVIRTLSDMGIHAGRIKGLTGVWVDYNTSNPRKICALGVKASRWVTMHGFAFNVNTDLGFYKNIIPCGIEDKAVTSLQLELGDTQDIDSIKDQLLNHLSDIFEMHILR